VKVSGVTRCPLDQVVLHVMLSRQLCRVFTGLSLSVTTFQVT
jgi:hypothetical protein